MKMIAYLFPLVILLLFVYNLIKKRNISDSLNSKGLVYLNESKFEKA